MDPAASLPDTLSASATASTPDPNAKPLANVSQKLRETRPLDESVLMLYIKDGVVWYRDDGAGDSAYKGHDYAEGDDELVSFGPPLDVAAAQDPACWRVTSSDDPAYADNGLAPVAVHRKSKPNNVSFFWEHLLDHWLFLVLPSPMREGASYIITVDPRVGLGTEQTTVHFDSFQHQSEALHVNLCGVQPQAIIKPADLYYWMGDGGPRDYNAFVGKPVWLVEVESGQRHEVGRVQFWKSAQAELGGRDLVGSPVWTVDFSDFQEPGRYRLVVEGVGASEVFPISPDVYTEPFRTSVRGFYYMRMGEAVDTASPPPRQPRFIPGEDPTGFTIYLTDLHPWHPAFIDYPCDTWDEPHHVDFAELSIFWKHRLPGHPTNDKAVGGHADAMDWDRHLGHVSMAYDLLLGYFLSDGNLDDDNTGIRESGSGVPDLISEARNEVDLFLSLRDGDGYGHGLTNPCKAHRVMFQAGATTIAAWANAANAAMLAAAYRLSGDQDLCDHYVAASEEAFAYASRQDDQMLDIKQDVGDSKMRGRDFRALALAWLYNATGETKWEDLLAEADVVPTPTSPVDPKGEPTQLWTVAAYLLCPFERHYPVMANRMLAALRKETHALNLSQVERRPSRRASSYFVWQTPLNVQRMLLLHKLSDDPTERLQLERAFLLEASWGLGRNPSNMVEMTGLGPRHVVNCYSTGRNDGVPGLHPGHTPYHNIDPWSFDRHGGNPGWLTSKCYPEWKAGWPLQEGHFDNRYSWSNSEFTPQQTMRGKMAAYAYLHYLAKSAPVT